MKTPKQRVEFLEKKIVRIREEYAPILEERDERIAVERKKIEKIQDECDHKGYIKEYRGDDGDGYSHCQYNVFYNCSCPKCGKIWRIEETAMGPS